jgi:RNA polymerase sigma-32 factor
LPGDGANVGIIVAAHQLVGAHLRLVTKIAKAYHCSYGLPLDELISEGNPGIMLAVQRFDPDRGSRFATYAVWWIRAAMQDHILRSRSMVKMVTTTGTPHRPPPATPRGRGSFSRS